MAAQAILVLCASALIQTISGQAIGNKVYADEVDIKNFGVSGNGVGLITGGAGFGNGVSMGAGYGPGLGLAGYGTGIGVAGCGSGIGLGAANLGYGAGLNGLAFNGINSGLAAPSNGGGFTVTSVSPIAPTGLSVSSENVIEGPVAVIGALPFLGAVALEGQVPATGAAGVQYSCGNGNVGIVSEGVGATAGVTGAGLGLGAAGLAGAGVSRYGLANAGLGYSTGLATGLGGCGCGAIY